MPDPVPSNLFADIPDSLTEECFDTLAGSDATRVVRIVSIGHATPDGVWLDQNDTEWVVLLQGEARLRFEHRGLCDLRPGDHLTIPAGCRHRVESTSTQPAAIWLAVHYSGA